jgi:photosystem II stability/assembly factor-like uncharacterized protein
MIIRTIGRYAAVFSVLLLFVFTSGNAVFGADNAIISKLAPHRLLLDATTAEGLIVVVGERGHILSSRDDGRTWHQASVPTRVTLTGVFMHNEHLGWAVGHDGVILRTENGADSWTLLYAQGEEDRPLLDILFLDKDRGIAIGAYGLFLSTADGGDTWMEGIVSEEDWHLNHISRSTTGRLYIAAEGGHIFRYDDNGETWTQLSSPYTGSFFGTLPMENDSLLLFGLRGHLFRSENAGNSWHKIPSGTLALLSGGLIMQDGTVVVVGLNGTILSSKDNGRHFDLEQLPNRNAISTVVRTSDNALLLVGEAGIQRYQIP